LALILLRGSSGLHPGGSEHRAHFLRRELERLPRFTREGIAIVP
jgi:hypothetical protein